MVSSAACKSRPGQASGQGPTGIAPPPLPMLSPVPENNGQTCRRLPVASQQTSHRRGRPLPLPALQARSGKSSFARFAENATAAYENKHRWAAHLMPLVLVYRNTLHPCRRIGQIANVCYVVSSRPCGRCQERTSHMAPGNLRQILDSADLHGQSVIACINLAHCGTI